MSCYSFLVELHIGCCVIHKATMSYVNKLIYVTKLVDKGCLKTPHLQ